MIVMTHITLRISPLVHPAWLRPIIIVALLLRWLPWATWYYVRHKLYEGCSAKSCRFVVIDWRRGAGA